jgi:Spy/CpxP family protein refolding chaperone
MSDDATTNRPADGPAPAPRRRPLRRTILALGILIAGGTGGYALAMSGPFHGGFGGSDPGQRLARLQFMTKRALDSVGATSDQENRVHDIIASAATALMKEGAPTAEMRKRLADLLKAPTVDRAAVEALRAEMVRSLDARSKIVAGALVDASGQLGAEQRAKLVDRVTTLMEQRRGFGPWHHRGDGEDERRDRAPGEAGAGPDRN